MMRSEGGCHCLHWAIAGRPFPGQIESGDRAVSMGWPGQAVLAVIDGLGHGPQAAAVAVAAAEVIESMEAPSTAEELVRACHDRLRGTRGAAMSVAVVDADAGVLSWVGVGNVEGVLLHVDGTTPREAIFLNGGIVGYVLPHLRPTLHTLHPGDLLIFATDGLKSSFFQDLMLGLSPQVLADRLLERHARETDDALVLVAEFMGTGHAAAD